MSDEIVLAWHFTGDKLRDGRIVPPVGEWLSHKGPVVICRSGFHASVCGFDALAFAPGPMLHRVELRGDIQHENDKLVARERRILWSIDATQTLREFSRAQALSVLHLWADAPAVVRQYLETGDESIRDAARTAARTAARDAAWAAAWDAAWAAAWAAARDAWAAAWTAARDAAWAAAWDAAWAAAWAAARDAAWDAARAAHIEKARADLNARFLALAPVGVENV